MNKKGFFALLTAAMAGAWETVVTQLKATFRYRVAGDTDNDDLPEKNGRAVINAIYGNTVKWNQLVEDPSLRNVSNWLHLNSTIELIEGGGFRITKNSNVSGGTLYKRDIPPVGHKCMIIVDIAEMNITGSSSYVCFGFSDNKFFTTKGYYAETVGRYGGIYNITEEHKSFGVRVGMGGTDIGSNATIKSINLFDLTEMGIDDIIDSYDDFKAWLALNVGEQDYYPYDEGSFISFKGTSIKSVGRNIWDGTYSRLRAYLSNSGAEVSNSSYNISSYIKVFPSTNYYFSKIFPNVASAASIGWYDNSKNFISAVSGANHVNNKILTSPVNAMYLRTTILPELVPTIINISDSKNGTYEPYWSDSIVLDTQTMTGKLLVDGEPTGESVYIFPNGMAAYDSESISTAVVEPDGYIRKVIKRSEHANLTQLGITSNNNNTFSTTSAGTERNGKIISDKYITVPKASTLTIFKNYCINNGITKGITTSDTNYNRIYVYDEDIITTTEFNNANANSYVVFTTGNKKYLLDTPILAQYKVDKYSTEELLVPASEAGEPTSTAIIADIEYQKKG